MNKETLSEETKVYRCWFDDPDGNRRRTDVPRHKGIVFFQHGLWVNDEWRYTGQLDDRNWIPPSRLVLVAVLESSNE